MRKALGIIVILVLLGGGFLWLLGGARDEVRGLDASTLGTDGLVVALEKAGIAVTLAAPGTSVKVSDVGLRIVPLYDMDLDDERPESIGDISLRNIAYWQLMQKTYSTRALVVLPKWRWAAAEKAIAAPETAIPVADYPKLFQQLNMQGLKLDRMVADFDTPMIKGHKAALFMTQRFDLQSLPSFCTSLLDDGAGALLISCDQANGGAILYLSDPDILNNHGLTLGDNAATLVTLIRGLQNAPKRAVYLDRLAADYVSRDAGDERQDYKRTPDDLLRFFKPPLGEIWAMLAILLALFLWRGGRRFGPVLRTAEETPERSRREAIATRARLIRLTGQDAAMVADYVKTDLTRMAETAFGRGKGEVGKLFHLLSRRAPETAATFQALALDLMRATPAAPARLRRQLDTYHQLQRTLTHGDDA